MNSLIERFGEGPVAFALLALALLSLLQPLFAAVERKRWRRVEARVTDVPQRRSLATGTWSVGIEVRDPDGAVHVTRVPVNISRHPLKEGDRIEVLQHPRSPARIVISRWQGAGTALAVAGLLLLGAMALVRGSAGASM